MDYMSLTHFSLTNLQLIINFHNPLKISKTNKTNYPLFVIPADKTSNHPGYSETVYNYCLFNTNEVNQEVPKIVIV